ncbi:hypothetical protein JW968_05965 [Candidatus Woesearchaeota archaeon]|nr:hypothetical protein [Candidatus Woesearchaeota archaeon]
MSPLPVPSSIPNQEVLKNKFEELGLGDVEMIQKSRKGKKEPTSYPQPAGRLNIIFEEDNLSLEEHYYWIIHQLRYDQDFAYMTKVMDIYAASEHSSFWGAAQQRLQLQQSQISNYLGLIGKMVKELFQLVRELRVLDEKLIYYKRSLTGDEAAEISLKGVWIDLVEGGTKNPASVYGMSSQVGFATLPDLFFSVHPKAHKEVNEVIDALKFNRKIKEVLKRKLFSYITWREATQNELENRRKFTLKYLRQHFDVINMYMSWVKPYLRNVRRLTMFEDHINSVDLIGAFEGNVVEVELLAHRKESQGLNAVILLNFHFRSQPKLDFQKDSYAHKGPIHVGRLEIVWRGYVWEDKQIKNYIKYRNEENLDLLVSIDQSVKAAMESLGEDLRGYLVESGENLGSAEEARAKKAEKKPVEQTIVRGILDPFVSIFKGPAPKSDAPAESSKQKYLKGKASAKITKTIRTQTYQCYKNFKKHNGMLSW